LTLFFGSSPGTTSKLFLQLPEVPFWRPCQPCSNWEKLAGLTKSKVVVVVVIVVEVVVVAN